MALSERFAAPAPAPLTVPALLGDVRLGLFGEADKPQFSRAQVRDPRRPRPAVAPLMRSLRVQRLLGDVGEGYPFPSSVWTASSASSISSPPANAEYIAFVIGPIHDAPVCL